MNIIESWKFWAFLSAIFAALTAIFGKVGVTRIDSNLATWYRTFVIFILLGVFILIKRIPIGSIFSDLRTWSFLSLSAICTGASWVSYYRALQLGPASRVAPIDKLSVVLVVIFACLFLGEALTWKVGLGTALITAGVILMTI